jgi:GTP-binding protein Era
MNELDTVFEDQLPDDHRSGVVAVAGRPNVGKSTLINQILGQKIAIVSPKPQTTRRQQLGIFTTERGQVLFTDTPGLHKPHHKLGEYMVTMAEDALRDADVILWLVDASVAPTAEDKHIAETMKRLRGDTPLWLLLNKIDLIDNSDQGTRQSTYTALIETDKVWLISALDGTGVPTLVSTLLDELPHGPRYYPVDQVSEVTMRFIAAETIREKIMLHTEQEVPHSVAVEITEYKERSATMTYIAANIYVERDTQKAIIIGKNGSLLKTIGTEAREELATTIGTQVYLELFVKVLKNWRMDEDLMRRLGYRIPKKE